jgi:hypothetical protein
MVNRINWSKDRDRRLMGAKGIDPIGGAGDAALVRAAARPRLPGNGPQRKRSCGHRPRRQRGIGSCV